MRIRSVKPEFYRDEVTGRMGCETAMFYVGLCGFADDAGCFEWNLQLIRADIDPFDAKWKGLKGIERQLASLETLNRIVRYKVNGVAYGRILSFRGHQNPKKPSYRCPLPDDAFGTDEEPVPNLFPFGSESVGSGSGGGSGEGSGSGEECGEVNSPPVVTLPCVGEGSKVHHITARDLASWRAAYPGLDPLGEAQRMKFWLEQNPTRRKTAKGMGRFISSWLSRSQDRGGRSAPGPPANGATEPPLHKLEGIDSEGRAIYREGAKA